MDLSTATSISMSHIKGNINYELSKLPIAIGMGNVLAVVSDRRVPHSSSGVINYYTADIVSSSDYYPFGMPMPGRNFSSNQYRYGFNGMEKDDELKGNGNSYDFGARIYDPRVGRFLSTDRFESNSPFNSPYVFASNSPIMFVDKNGDSTAYYSESGALLWVSHDGLDNSINIVKNSNLVSFYIGALVAKWMEKKDNNKVNENLRQLGRNYNLVEISKWASKIHQGEIVNGERNEKKSWLSDNNGIVQVFNYDDPEIGGPGVVAGQPERSPNNPVGEIHTHPIRYGLDRNPSFIDLTHTTAPAGYMDLVVEVSQALDGNTTVTAFYLYPKKFTSPENGIEGGIIRFNVMNDNSNKKSDSFKSKGMFEEE